MKPITVVLISTVLHDISKFAIEKTLENTPHVEDVIVFADKPIVNYGTFIPIKENFSYADYNYIMLKGLSPFIKTDFILHIHPDGFAVNKDMWKDEYLKYDYIGAPWFDKKVGNGGFSLRSYKLIDALTDSDIITHWIPQMQKYINEDHVICRYNDRLLYDKYRILFAPFELANTFSQEMSPIGNKNTFGFHGTWILPLFFDKKTIEKIMTNYYYKNDGKKEVFEQFLKIAFEKDYSSAFRYLEETQDKTGIHLWG